VDIADVELATIQRSKTDGRLVDDGPYASPNSPDRIATAKK
jgi:hypothetical protein